MLTVLSLLLAWVCLITAIIAICAAGGTADDQSEEWYREQQQIREEVNQEERGAA